MNRLLLGTAILILGPALLLADPAGSRTRSRAKNRAIKHCGPELPVEARLKRLRGSGLFVFHLRPDGTVWRVETRHSTGHAILDKACVEAFSKWRFAPTSTKEIKIPVTFTGNYATLQP